ncbi:MAG TPA: hypothetical protein VIC54_12075 [Terriglobales bacterium]|jgi:hypothetical protein
MRGRGGKMAFILVALSVALGAQDATRLLPQNYRSVFENAAVHVIHAHYAPHEKLPLHDHPPLPTVWVYLNDAGPIRFSHTEPRAYTLIRPGVAAGGFRIDPGKSERHTVENLSAGPSDFLQVELKQIPLGDTSLRARFRPRINRDHSSIAVDFDSPRLRIERILCAAHSPCPLARAIYPTLEIAITPAGNLRWLPPGAAAPISQGDFAQWLRIEFKPSVRH